MCATVIFIFVLASAPSRPKNLSEALQALCSHLNVGPGCVVADVGAGGGAASWVFSRIVGPKGIVYAEEIDKGKVERLRKEAEKRKLKNVKAVLGTIEDPKLPEGGVDLVYLHYVYHHFGKPRQMLRGILRALRPGGYFVVADRHFGTLRPEERVPRERRTHRHYWIAETTVVREAREEGFLFVEFAERFWHERNVFVLVFSKPKEKAVAGKDPDPFLELDAERTFQLIAPFRPYGGTTVFIALGEGRKLIPRLVKAAGNNVLDVVLEEWATQNDERPPLPEPLSIPSTLTDKGDPHLGNRLVSAVYFLDTYHLLFHGPALLSALRKNMAANGIIYILDRASSKPLSRREGSHRRMIHPDTVIKEMQDQGFYLWAKGPKPAKDRFLLCFGKVPEQEIWKEIDPLVAGPEIIGKAGDWLSLNSWRIRGFRTVTGERIYFPKAGTIRDAFCRGLGKKVICKVKSPQMTLLFRKQGKKLFLLTVSKRSSRDKEQA